MEYQEYINKKKMLYKCILSFIDYENDENLQNLNTIIESQKNQLTKEELILLFHLIRKLANNHHRHNNFFKKIEEILEKISLYMKQSFSNFDLFKIFESNKLILLYLIDHQVIKIDDKIAQNILNNPKNYCHFFYPEIKQFLNKKKIELFEKEINEKDQDTFDIKRRKGENDSYICTLIQQDSIDELVSFLNQSNISPSSKINNSIFETNQFLLKHNSPSLIEYAAFFGSFKIFQYLKENNVELTPFLWFYAIYGRNLDLIHLLESNNVEPPNNSYEECLKESIKCHHNEMTDYFRQKLINFNETSEMIYKSILQNYNFQYFPNELNDNRIIFYYLCKYEYFTIVDLYLKPKKDEIESKNIKYNVNLNLVFK